MISEYVLYFIRILVENGIPSSWIFNPNILGSIPPYNHHQPSITPYNHLNQPPQPSNICFTGRFIPLRLLPPEQNLPGFSHKLNLTGSHLGFGWKNRKNPRSDWTRGVGSPFCNYRMASARCPSYKLAEPNVHRGSFLLQNRSPSWPLVTKWYPDFARLASARIRSLDLPFTKWWGLGVALLALS